MTKARENSDYTGLAADITAGDTAARAGRKNLIINGDNRISQRGTYTSALDFVHNQYCFDRWKSNKSGGSIDGTIVQSSATIDGAICITQLYTVTTGSAGSYIGAHQRLEFPETFIGRTVTISAWVKSNTTTARLQIYNQASGGNATIAVDTHTGGGAWEYLTATGTVLAGTTALSLFVATLTEAAGTVTTVTGDYIEFTNVQMELGSVATDFEHRSYGEELALCQRYYQKYGGTAYATIASGMQPNTTNAKFHLSYMQEMRSVPSLNASNVANLIVTDRTAFDQPLSGFTGHAIGKTSAYMSAQFSAVGATGRGILLAVKNGTTTTVNLDAEL